MTKRPVPEEFKEIIEMQASLLQKMKDDGLQNIKKFFKRIFDEIPNLKSITFQGYTPYFNDGDICEYHLSMDYPNIQFIDGTNGIGGDDNFECEPPWKWEEEKSKYSAEQLKRFTEYKQAKNYLILLYGVEEMCKLTFGDHAQITVTQDDIQIDEYNHD